MHHYLFNVSWIMNKEKKNMENDTSVWKDHFDLDGDLECSESYEIVE